MRKMRGRPAKSDARMRKYFARLIERHGLRGAGEASKIHVSQHTLRKVARAFGIRLQSGRRPSNPSQVPKPALSNLQKAQLAQILAGGAMGAGYRSDQWTCRRIIDVVRKSFGVKCHPIHLKAVLGKLGLHLVERRVYLIRPAKSAAELPEEKCSSVSSESLKAA